MKHGKLYSDLILASKKTTTTSSGFSDSWIFINFCVRSTPLCVYSETDKAQPKQNTNQTKKASKISCYSHEHSYKLTEIKKIKKKSDHKNRYRESSLTSFHEHQREKELAPLRPQGPNPSAAPPPPLPRLSKVSRRRQHTHTTVIITTTPKSSFRSVFL